MNAQKLRARLGALLLGSLSLLAAAPAWASYVNLGPASDYNIFLFGDNTQYNSDVEGPLAVGGNVDFTTKGTGFTVASKMPSSGVNLVVGGNYKNQWYSLGGGMLVNGNVDWMGPTVSGSVSVNGSANFHNSGGSIAGPVNVVGTYSAPGYFPPNAANPSVTPLPFDFDEVRSYLESQSTSLASLAPNGATEIFFNQVHLTAAGPSDALYVFNVLGSQLANAAGAGLFIDAPAGSTVVVNIDGDAGSFHSMGIFLTGVERERVLYNFYEATSLYLNSISIEGTILAPYASIDFVNGQINGALIGNHLTGAGESHWHPFQGELPNPVPEPSTLALACCGAIGLWMGRVRLTRAGRQPA